jgi:pilus assembly protein CpaC
MHRKTRVLNWLAGGLVGLGLTQGTAPAQPEAAPPLAAMPRGQTNAMVVAINGTKKLSMTTKRPLRSVVNEKESVARVQAISDDPTAVLVVGLQAGSTRVSMTDDLGNKEEVDIVVQIDIDVVKTVIKKTFPTASVEPIAVGTNTIVLSGTVAHADEIEAILRVAHGVLWTGTPANQGAGSARPEIVNAMSVGGVRQVQLDVTIAAVNRSELRNLGVNWTFAGSEVFGGSLIGQLTQAGQSAGGGGGAGGAGSSVILGSQNFLGALTPNQNANLVFGIVPSNLNFFIQALRQERLAKLLAEPKLVTKSGRPATFLSGGQQAVPEVTASGVGGGTVGTRFEPFGTQLTFLPIVLGNGKIYLDIESSVSNLNAANGFTTGGILVAGRDEQFVRTSVEMEPGQTFAIGGLIQNSVQAITNKTPILGDLPFVGVAFSTVSHQETETELVVLVTPYLVDGMDCKQAPCKLPGLETRSPDDFELFLELILEAPRGSREVFPGGKYKPSWMNDPTANQFPCGGAAGGAYGPNGGPGNGCANGSCGPTAANGGPPPAPAVPREMPTGVVSEEPAMLPPAAAHPTGIRR